MVMMPLFYWIDQYVDTLQRFLGSRAVLAPLLLLLIEEAGVPLIVPGDAVIAYTGYRLSVTHGGVGFWEAFLTAQAAVVAGSTILFYLSRHWGQFIVDKIGAFIFLKEKHIRQAERMFAKYGVFAIIVGRHIPGLRIPITFFAATSGVKYLTFIISTLISTSIWIGFYLTVGKDVGAALHRHLRGYVLLSLVGTAAIVVGMVLLHLFGLYRSRRHQTE